LAAFVDDAPLARTFERYFDVTVGGSMLAFDFDTEVLADHPQALALMGPAFRMRSPSAFAALLGRWTLTEEGTAPVDQWGRPGAGTRSGTGAGTGSGTGGEPVAPAAFHGGLAIRTG
jgi:hypothetical protein